MHETQLIFSTTFPSISRIILSDPDIEIIIRVGNITLATTHRITGQRGSLEAGKVCTEEASCPHLQTSKVLAIPSQPVPPLWGNVASARQRLQVENGRMIHKMRGSKQLQARIHNEPEFQTPNPQLV
jgi:hypothetical protein